MTFTPTYDFRTVSLRQVKNFSSWFFEKVQDPLLSRGLHLARICMGHRDYADIRSEASTVFDVTTRGELLQMGHMGSLYGADVILDKMLRPGHFNFEAEDGSSSLKGRICEFGHVDWGCEWTEAGECECPACVVSFVLKT